MLPPQGLSRPPGTARNPSRLPRARGERKLFLQHIVLPEQDSSGTVQPLAASPQISSAGASPPGSASPAVGVGSEGLSPPSRDGVSITLLTPQWAQDGTGGAGSRHRPGEDGPRNVWCPFHRCSDNFLGTKSSRGRGDGLCHSCSAEGVPRLGQEGHLTHSPKRIPCWAQSITPLTGM